MLRNPKGFFLLELLLSLSALFMVCLFILPIYIDIQTQCKRLEIENKARQLMYEELQTKLMNQQPFTDYSVRQNGIEYKIVWRNSSQAGKMEVCIRVDSNSFLPKTELCGILE